MASFAQRAEVDGCATSAGAFGRCLEINRAFVERATRAGLRAELVLLVGAPTLRSAHGDWQRADPDTVCHFVAEVEGRVVDWTARQLDVDAPFPRTHEGSADTLGWGAIARRPPTANRRRLVDTAAACVRSIRARRASR